MDRQHVIEARWFPEHLNGATVAFDDLPEPAKLALLRRLSECDDAPVTPEEASPVIGDLAMRYAEVPVEAVKKAVAETTVAGGEHGHRDFDEYHAWYCRQGVPDHRDGDRWPAIAWNQDDEVFEDGWHRFHSYVRAGHQTIPVLFVADQRLAQRMDGWAEAKSAEGAAADAEAGGGDDREDYAEDDPEAEEAPDDFWADEAPGDDWEAIEGRYRRGGCHVLAIALARRTGWPLIVFRDPERPGDVTHVAVRHADDFGMGEPVYADVKGLFTEDEMRDGLLNGWELELGEASEEEVRAEHRLADFDEGDLAEAERVVELLIARGVLSGIPEQPEPTARAARPR